MLEIKKYAAIDIGSNAIRLLVSNVIVEKNREPQFKKSSLVRVPIRLGADVFVSGKISEANITRMINAIQAFKLLMDVHGVERYKACATSAMREAKNGKEVAHQISKETAIDIDIINGKKEAAIISSTDLSELIQGEASYLYVDVGGGSTEFTVFSKGKIINSKSFKMGTVRLINNKKAENKAMFKEVEKWIKENTKDLKRISLIGSGGNINKIFKMSGRTIGKPISYIYLNAQYQFLKQMSYKERISELSLNPDRADVIVPATKIYLSAMKWSGARKIFVPKIGLSDGIIKSLYFNKL
ncbi:Ppx/GppA phosphatase family protein [Tenacibaculum maritimum]|uniref:Ppx/GppA phosphatase family protein n=1 Tax=Tenacibaculum maritimum TaxID=107401 RepID=UPI0012E58A22|nr:ethanolamine ammonia-lyase reactivating factor EutA [Tenacibaculum maritimum]MCD9563224.1 ethanolamine ammonia-lyase reactivating factor EutA [Tenacibaculum maritimum]MCD9566524.1 ethanolamine ammonia-lyase reactivating factor EutA [Tenacibaculum maritimum]MCD9579862.1 ethanolamine ammonia-lyase reactivating factor EutA [Tenacibaculum maritimum]MCD9597382.1 ethanolamine ammonia-lyase reactivating factor EutA [Tenacibaculum maritimum]MCD9614432.1 ethanolamine ammonia-lyase reactivating facto